MKIREALITEIKEDVTTRDFCGGGLALMHGGITIIAMGILDDGRCVRFCWLPGLPGGHDTSFSKTLDKWSKYLAGQTLPPTWIIEDLSNPKQPAEATLQREEIDLGI